MFGGCPGDHASASVDVEADASDAPVSLVESRVADDVGIEVKVDSGPATLCNLENCVVLARPGGDRNGHGQGGTSTRPSERITRSIPSTRIARTATGSKPGSGTTAERFSSAPISMAAKRPGAGRSTSAAHPPESVTEARMPA